MTLFRVQMDSFLLWIKCFWGCCPQSRFSSLLLDLVYWVLHFFILSQFCFVLNINVFPLPQLGCRCLSLSVRDFSLRISVISFWIQCELFRLHLLPVCPPSHCPESPRALVPLSSRILPLDCNIPWSKSWFCLCVPVLILISHCVLVYCSHRPLH